MTPEDYAEKVERKRDRYAERAAKKRGESTSAHKASRAIIDRIPMGQPILVGHHSEGRHRRDLERSDRNMRKAIDAGDYAAHLQHRAETYGTHSISSDDPDAVAKLRAELVQHEADRTNSKQVNKILRKAIKAAGEAPDYIAVINSLDIAGLDKRDLIHTFHCFGGRLLKCDTTNTSASIRRIKKRIAVLEEAAATEEAPDIVGDGWRIEECKEDNRIRFHFDERPSKDTCRAMRGAGFKWARSVGAWQRQLTNSGRYAAQRMARELFPDDPEGGQWKRTTC